MKIAQVAPLIESVPPRLYGGTERIVSVLSYDRRAVRRRFEGRFDATRMAKNYVRAYRGLLSRCSNKVERRSILPPQLDRNNGSGLIHHVE